MPNVLVSNLCNRRCPYCFGGEKVDTASGGAPAFMSLDDFRLVLDYHRRAHIPTVSVLGGEPSLHPEFPALVNLILEQGLRLKLFSNGMMPEPARAALARIPCDRLDLVVNINHEHDRAPGEWEQVRETLCALHASASLAHTVYDPDLLDGWLLAIACQLRLRPSLRLGLAQPNAQASNRFLPLHQYRRTAERILQLTAEADKLDLAVGFDCGFQLCQFTEAELGSLVLRNCDAKFVCKPVLDIGTDLATWHCFPLAHRHNRNLRDFATLDEAIAYYGSMVQAERAAGSQASCFRCRYLLRGQCGGGCLAHGIRALHYAGPPDEHVPPTA